MKKGRMGDVSMTNVEGRNNINKNLRMPILCENHSVVLNVAAFTKLNKLFSLYTLRKTECNICSKLFYHAKLL
jgi:hypothetical protein